jgi:hypothetical protein
VPGRLDEPARDLCLPILVFTATAIFNSVLKLGYSGFLRYSRGDFGGAFQGVFWRFWEGYSGDFTRDTPGIWVVFQGIPENI